MDAGTIIHNVSLLYGMWNYIMMVSYGMLYWFVSFVTV
jgi:hypothetical protein